MAAWRLMMPLFYIFLLNYQNIASVEQKNYKKLFLDFFLNSLWLFQKWHFYKFSKMANTYAKH
jgi:hypothetical protein